MRIMGIDISSKSTGWGVIDNGKLSEFGKINPTGTMTHAQKLYYFHVELERVISRQKPDEIAIEDVVQVKSVSVAKILARFNGVAIVEAYRYLQRDPIMFEPTEWKKLVVGFGTAKKCETQLFVCEHYGLLPKDKIVFYGQAINEIKAGLGENNDAKKVDLKLLKKQLKKCKDEVQIKQIKDQIENAKVQNDTSRKKNKKDASKLFDDISMKIYTESSINEDIADAICVAGACNIAKVTNMK
jgi:Holliday junction resolvasome RuvABC endonuclease subunit